MPDTLLVKAMAQAIVDSFAASDDGAWLKFNEDTLELEADGRFDLGQAVLAVLKIVTARASQPEGPGPA
jgi:hypothetical protein